MFATFKRNTTDLKRLSVTAKWLNIGRPHPNNNRNPDPMVSPNSNLQHRWDLPKFNSQVEFKEKHSGIKTGIPPVR